MAQGCARRQDRGQGPRRARLHPQDRHAVALRHQPAVRPVPRRVQLQPGHRPDDRQADRHGRRSAPTTSRSSPSPRSASTTPTSSSATSSTGSPARCCGRRSTRTSRTYYNSKHQAAGVECSQCHMPKVKDPKTGKTFTSHWQTSPKHYIKETCLTCHKDWSEKQANYAIDSLKNRFAGKVAQGRVLADAVRRQVRGGAEPRRGRQGARRGARQALRRARELGMVDGLQRRALPQPGGQATESLNKSMTVSQEGIKLLDDAMAAKRKATTTTAAAPAPAGTGPRLPSSAGLTGTRGRSSAPSFLVAQRPLARRGGIIPCPCPPRSCSP